MLVIIAVGNQCTGINAVDLAKLASNILIGAGESSKHNFAQIGGTSIDKMPAFKEELKKALISSLRLN